MAGRSTEQRLQNLIDQVGEQEGEVLTKTVRKALGDKHYRMVGKAAQTAGERFLYDLEADLLSAYQRFLVDPVKRDPHCIAKGAIVRALVDLDCLKVDFFLTGLRYRQLEPVWGGSVDTALDIRASCAQGLVGTSYFRTAAELAVVLNDPEAGVRESAARALACLPADRAEPVLRCKALSGDPEPGVTAQCLAGLLAVEPDESLAFVAGFLEHDSFDLREQVALVLGESRLSGALPILRQCFEQPLLTNSLRLALIRALVLHRSVESQDWLIEMIARQRVGVAALVVRELAVFAGNAKLHERVSETVRSRDSDELLAEFREHWP